MNISNQQRPVFMYMYNTGNFCALCCLQGLTSRRVKSKRIRKNPLCPHADSHHAFRFVRLDMKKENENF